jgi:hypothetical protein
MLDRARAALHALRNYHEEDPRFLHHLEALTAIVVHREATNPVVSAEFPTGEADAATAADEAVEVETNSVIPSVVTDAGEVVPTVDPEVTTKKISKKSDS